MPRREGYTTILLEVPVELNNKFREIAKSKHLIMRRVAAELLEKWIKEQKENDNRTERRK